MQHDASTAGWAGGTHDCLQPLPRAVSVSLSRLGRYGLADPHSRDNEGEGLRERLFRDRPVCSGVSGGNARVMSEKESTSLLPRLGAGLHWSLQLGARFLREAPGGTTLVVLATLVSQVAMLLAFFLPLKVVILLGREQVPDYFPGTLAAIDRGVLIGWLTLATVVAFGVFLLAERLIRFGADQGARRILERSQKVVLFENQDAIATRAYRRYAVIPAGLVFVVLAMGVLGWLYPSVLALVAAFVLVVLGLVVFGSRVSGRLYQKVLAPPKAWLPGAAQLGFLLVFVWLVGDYLYRDPPGLLAAIIALLLARQMLNRLAGIATSLVSLNNERPRLDALFFHHQVFQRPRHRRGQGLWSLLEETARNDWIPQVLQELDDAPGRVCGAEWWQTRVPDVMAIHCVMEAPWDPRLIKVFDRNRSGEARHEASLLADAPEGLPAPVWIGATTVDGFSCHVLRLPPDTQQLAERLDPTPADARNPPDSAESGESGEEAEGPDLVERARWFRESMLVVEPPAELAGRYARSRPLLWQRLDRVMLERVRLVADAAGRDCIDDLLADFEAVVERVRSLPWVFVNRQLNAETLATAGEHVIALHWGRWGLETLGTGWPLSALEPDALAALLVDAGRRRPILSRVDPAAVRLTGLLSLLERLYRAQRYADILELLPELQKSWRALEDRAGPPAEQDTAFVGGGGGGGG